MLKSYFPIYEVARKLETLRSTAQLMKSSKVYESDTEAMGSLLSDIARVCPEYGLTNTAGSAERISKRSPSKTYAELLPVLDGLNDTISNELEKEALFRIPPERKVYYEKADLFGPKVRAAFPSCDRDIQKAGSCYALGQEDGCVHLTSC
jgi:hypothetical protein